MRKAALLYNPLSGPRSTRRKAAVDAAVEVLEAVGIGVQAEETRQPPEIPAQVREIVAAGYDTVIACGGDGTIHDVLQSLVGTNVALGMIPLGTANALAHDLRIPRRSPARAAQTLIAASPKRIAVGRVEYSDFGGNRAIRYFTVAAGVGVDAHLFYRLNALVKGHMGMAAYYAKAWHLWLTHRMRHFAVRYDQEGSEKQAISTELLAVRIRNFGGVLRELAPGASLDRNDLRLVMCNCSKRSLYLLYVLRGLLGAQWKIKDIELAYSMRVRCECLPQDHPEAPACEENRLYLEADGELLGTLPAEISIVPDALTLLVP